LLALFPRQMKLLAMRPIIAMAAIWLFPNMCVALDDELVGAAAARAEKKEAFTPKQCLAVVKKVQASNRYTEESIVPVCAEEMSRSSCEFFAEALSLASSHADFTGSHFCDDMDRAQFCSDIMDKLLESNSVSDLAFGECERAKPQKNLEYCRRMQSMLRMSVQQEDLDTMRACYMQEAYTNTTSSKAAPAAPQQRIITGSSKELDNIEGKGAGQGHPPKQSNIGKGNIVVQPVPLENFGEGKGNMTKPIAEPSPAPAPAPAAVPEKPSGPILVKPIPAPAAVPEKTSGPILEKPIPAEKGLVQTASTKVTQAAQPLVAQAIMQNGTLVMTGAPFGRVVVRGIEEALKKQVVIQKAAAQKMITAPKVGRRTTPTRAKVGLVVVKPPRVVVAPTQKAATPAAKLAAVAPQQVVIHVVVEQQAAPLSKAAPLAKPLATAVQKTVQASLQAPAVKLAVRSAAKAAVAAAVVAAPVVLTPAAVTPVVQAQVPLVAKAAAVSPATPQEQIATVQVVMETQPVAKAPVAQTQAAADAPKQPITVKEVVPAQPLAKAAQPVAKTQPVVAKALVAPPKQVLATVQAPKTPPPQEITVKVVVSQATAKAPAASPTVAAQQQPAVAPPAVALKQQLAVAKVAEVKPTANAAVPKAKAVATVAATASGPSMKKATPATKDAKLKTISKHSLAQAVQQVKKVQEKKQKKSDSYSGFLSGFVSFSQE